MIVVSRIDVARRSTLTELNRVLAIVVPPSKLGFVLTGAEHEEGFAYGYGRYYYGRPTRAEATFEHLRSPDGSGPKATEATRSSL